MVYLQSLITIDVIHRSRSTRWIQVKTKLNFGSFNKFFCNVFITFLSQEVLRIWPNMSTSDWTKRKVLHYSWAVAKREKIHMTKINRHIQILPEKVAAALWLRLLRLLYKAYLHQEEICDFHNYIRYTKPNENLYPNVC